MTKTNMKSSYLKFNFISVGIGECVPHEPLGAVLILCGNVQKNHQDAKFKVHDMNCCG
jgi:hypothetical protein